MTKRQRKYLSKLHESVSDFNQFVPYVQNDVIKTFLNSVVEVLYGVLTDSPENEYLYEDLENATKALDKMKDILSKEHAIT